MPATTPKAIKRKEDNRKSKKDIGRETKIAELGGTPITVKYGEPLSESVRKERLEYLWDLMYPNRHVFKSTGRVKLTEAERKEKQREYQREKYKRAKEKRGLTVREQNKHGKTYTPWYIMWAGAKNRSESKNVPFDITPEDVYDLIVDLQKCPALGIDLCWTNNKLLDNSPTLDRIIPELGYVKGNIAVISNKANRIKTDASFEELGKVYCWLRRNTSQS